MRKFLLAGTAAVLAITTQVSGVFACGGLVAPNGSVRLDRATTLVAWHDGVEHYMTAFSYQGDVSGLGWIVPLPAVPDSIKEGGAWTLQRLEREVAPPPPPFAEAFGGGREAASARVIETVQVEALDITVIKGSGPEILQWCRENGFTLPADTRDHLLIYAKGSPIFMAAKYNLTRARARHQLTGDGAPVLITMHVARPWVPLEVLANDGDPVNADLFMLTDRALYTGQENLLSSSTEGVQLPGAPGFILRKQEPMNASLYRDLSSDRNMGWVPRSGYLTYLQLGAPSETVTYDLGVTDDGRIQLVDFGTPASQAGVLPPSPRFAPDGTNVSVAVLIAVIIALAGAAFMLRPRPPRARAA